jgi:hypothetical protein
MSAPTLNPQREAEASLDKAFTEHTVHTKTDEELVQFLHVLENRAVHNDLVCHREIIRALTINQIRMSRFLKSLDVKNARLSRLVIILTIVAVIAGTVQAIAAVIQICLMLSHQ